MNDARTVAELERALKVSDADVLQPDILARVRTLGGRRRRARLAATTGAALAAVVAVSLVAVGLSGVGDRGRDVGPAGQTMSPVAQRALDDIPGAVQVSGWQVVIPLPDGAAPRYATEDPVRAGDVAAGPVDIGTRDYVGVTRFKRAGFPAWLYDATLADEGIEHNGGDAMDSTAIGSTDLGVIVDAAPLRLACLRSDIDDQPCYPTMVSGPDGDLVPVMSYDNKFLEPGQPMQVFSVDTFTNGSAQQVWYGGTHGTDIASVELVTVDGDTVSATLASGTLVPGDTVFWGTVDGDVATVVTRDADGVVLERHEIETCSGDDCETR